MDNIDRAIKQANLGRERKGAQEDVCSVFAAALYDALIKRGIKCEMITAHWTGINVWYHSVVKIGERFYDSMGEFSEAIYRNRAAIHPSVTDQIIYSPDIREECYEEEFHNLYSFFLDAIERSFQKQLMNGELL